MAQSPTRAPAYRSASAGRPRQASSWSAGAAYKYWFIDFKLLLKREDEAAKYKIGMGDDVFMVGRSVNHDGRARNAPTIRFGHFAAMPDEPIQHPGVPSGEQVGLLVELHSISGFSGSPVFVRPDPNQSEMYSVEKVAAILRRRPYTIREH